VNVLKRILLFIGTLILGYFGGLLCGFIILLFGDYIGRSGTTGTEYFGYWNPRHTWFEAKVYGGPLGVFVCPIGYFVFLRHVNFLKALWVTLFGTILGGCIGALSGAPTAVVTGCVGFFTACSIAARK